MSNPTPSLLSLAHSQVQYIRSRLQKPGKTQGRPALVVCTGKTHSGKSRLGNLLSGRDVLPSDGRMDCTAEVHIVSFPAGLTYVDLPGVASDDQYENFNRAALGMAQIADWPPAGDLRVVHHHKGQDDIDQLHQSLEPDVILYMIAPNHLLVSSEVPYLRALLRAHPPERIVYVLNCFGSKESDSTFTTENNMSDATNKIRDAHHHAMGAASEPHIVVMNCWNGQGILTLLKAISAAAPVEARAPFLHLNKDIDQAAIVFLQQVYASLVPILVESARLSPPDFGSGIPLENQLRQLLAQVTSLFNLPGHENTALFRHLAQHLIALRAKCTTSRQEPILRTVRESQFVPVHGYELEDDYDQPIYEIREESPGNINEFISAVGNWFNESKFKVKKQAQTGYRQKRVYGITGYRTEYTSCKIETGSFRTITQHQCFGKHAVALLIAAAEIFVRSDSENLDPPEWDQIIHAASDRLGTWPFAEGPAPNQRALGDWLNANVHGCLAGPAMTRVIQSLWLP